MAEFIDVWVNCPTQACAQRIADACVGEHLAACANIWGPIASTYQWRGRIEKTEEVPLLLKSRANLFEVLAERIRELHPYETPSIVATELKQVDANYAIWIKNETGG